MRWLQEKMRGRYGSDQLNQFVLIVLAVLTVINFFFRDKIVTTILFLLLGICYFRMFSKNYGKRYEENARFLKIYQPIRYKLGIYMDRRKDKERKYYKCPRCSKTVRVPRGKGKICITCPSCKEEFVRRT